MRRKQATKLIDELRVLAARHKAKELSDYLLAENLERLLKEFLLTPLEACGGEAHSNCFIDNCMRCATRWGWVGPVEVVS